MDELMKQALDKHKIVRYIPTFIEVMETYKTLLEAENQALRQLPVIGSVCEKCKKGESYADTPLCKECLLEIYDKQTVL